MIWIGLTLFRSTDAQIDRIVALQAASGCPAIAFDNGGVAPEALARLRGQGIAILSEGRNLGIAAALNALAAEAAARGGDALVFLDQDAQADAVMIRGLAAAYGRLGQASPPPAVVGPAPSPAEADAKAPRYPVRPGIAPRGDLVPVDFLATSGSLVDLAAFRAIGPFRVDYFIDAVELEWCFRAWASGYGCWMARDVSIGHRVGAGIIRSRRLGIAMPRQPLFRMATYLRNSVYGWRLAHIPRRWKLRQAVYLPVQVALYWRDAGYRPAILLRLGRAVLDGLAGRLGRPSDLPDSSPEPNQSR